MDFCVLPLKLSYFMLLKGEQQQSQGSFQGIFPDILQVLYYQTWSMKKYCVVENTDNLRGNSLHGTGTLGSKDFVLVLGNRGV